MGYSLITIKKIKSDEDFLNIEQELCKQDTGNLSSAFHEKQASLQWYQEGNGKRKLRKNGVWAIAISFFYTDAEHTVDFNQWIEVCLNWMKSHFIVSEKTLLLWEYSQASDSGSAYAVLIPINPSEKICYEYYFPKKSAFVDCINSYTECMDRYFHLTKPSVETINAAGKRKSVVFHASPDAILPKPAEGEDIQEYYLRINDIFLEHYIASSCKLSARIKEIEKTNEQIMKDLVPLYNLTKKYGPPERWSAMMQTALKVQYAARACQSKGDSETVAELMRILKIGEDYILKHKIKF